jgi:hypothetical protein
LGVSRAEHDGAGVIFGATAAARLSQGDEQLIAVLKFPTAMYATIGVAFEPDNRRLLLTDGLTEAAADTGSEFFGDAELAPVLMSAAASGNLMQAVLYAHRRWIEGAPLSDDVSVVVVERVELERCLSDLTTECRDLY